jgi:RNA polymerase sigma factor (sigma-70 family)
MAVGQANSLLRYLHQIAVAGSAAGVPDGALLERFVRHDEEAAFAALLRRHGPMVLGLCRRVLRDEHAAEDALQETFVVLARKAHSLRQPESLGPWLHGVALRIARRARVDAARRRNREAKAARTEVVEDKNDLVWQDMRPLLDEAVAALGEKYRVPFIRCYLQGETVAEAARQLGCPKGTIAVRLARAREQVRMRLSRRGVSLSLAALTAALANGEAPALTPALRETLMAAIPRGAEVAGLAKVVVFMKGVITMMAKLKFKWAALLALSFSAAGSGVVLFVRPSPAEQRTPEIAPRPELIAPDTKSKLCQHVYQVTDLVALIERAEKVDDRAKKLINLIVKLIAPESWAERGGRGTVDFHPLTNALVVNQTAAVQDQVRALLSILHRLAQVDDGGEFADLLIDSKEGQAMLRRYLESARKNEKATREK